MEDVRFDRPVKILTGKSFSVSRQVETAAQAGDYLLNKWPAEAAGGEGHSAAHGKSGHARAREGLEASWRPATMSARHVFLLRR